MRTRIVDNINAETLSSDKFSTERLDRETLEESIDTSLAGIASEKLIFGKYDVGGGSDLTKALKTNRHLAMPWIYFGSIMPLCPL